VVVAVAEDRLAEDDGARGEHRHGGQAKDL
jgi:hypothetical protein